ncbi:MAG: DegV family protein [Bacilli bacterium]|nr:DegV family protein [Bacilli bacterium]
MNHSFAIMTDTTAEISTKLQERFHIDEVLHAHINTPDKGDCISDNDWILYPNPNEFYRQLSGDKKLEFSTSPCNPDEIKTAVRKYFDKGIDVLYLSLSSALSGTYDFAVQAKKELLEEYPGRKLIVVDTYRYSLAIALLCIKAAEKREEGKTIEEVEAYIHEIKNTLHEAGPMDDLFFLARKGRVAKGAAFMGTLVGVKPIGDFDREGKTKVFAKAVGLKKAIEVCTEYVKRTIVNPEEQIIFVAHTDREKPANLLKDAIMKEIKPKEIILVECGPSIGINVGPGLYAAFYFGKEISEGNVEEEKIMKEIMGK